MDKQEKKKKKENQQMASIYHLNGKYLAYVGLENSAHCHCSSKSFAHIRPENH